MREMKDSGVAWIGEIPKSWNLERLQWHISEIKETNKPEKTKQILSLTNKRGVIPYEEKGAQGNVSKEDFSQYKLAYPDTIVANSMNVLIGSVGKCNYYGCVSPVYYVYKPNDGENLEFINYIFQTEQFQKELRRYANGILEIRLRVSSDGILKRKVAFPSTDEQQKIVIYLNQKLSQVDSLIANVQAQIEKLKAYKQSLITEVVTKGLGPNAPMKDSGVEWIGEIPAHWGTAKLQYCAELRSGITLGKKYPKDIKLVERPYLRVANVQSGGVTLENIKTVQVTEEEDAQYRLTAGEVLMTEGGDRDKLGRGCVWNGQIEPCLHQNHIFALRTSKNLDPQFLSYVTASKIGRVYFDITAIKTTNLACTNSSKVLAFKLPLPPIAEQQGITVHLNNKCSQIEQLISLKESKIEKLQQYKRSLIYEYVTGKKEVV